MMRSILILLVLLIPLAVQAHKISVFAYAEGDAIKGETGFHGGKAARNVEISVTARHSGELVLTTRSNDSGEFSFPISDSMREKKEDLLIIVNGGDGHKNQWLMTAQDYLPESVVSQDNGQPAVTVAQEETVQENVPATATIDTEQIRTIVAEEISRQIAPINRTLAKQAEKQISLQDIIGGLGYILGLAGLAAFMKYRKEKAQ